MVKKYIALFLMIGFLFCCGCARGLEKSCKTLRNVNEDLSEIYPIFYSVSQDYPDKISLEDLETIGNVQDIINALTNASCGLNEVVSNK